MIAGKTILITGGTGFIGSALARRLENNNKVILFDKSLGHDLLNYKQLCSMMKGADVVVHLAAIAGQNIAWKMPRETMEVNVIGTYNVLNAMVENKVKHIVFASTSEVYGPEIDDAKEDQFLLQGPPQQIRWMYATSKLACENFIYAYRLKYGMKTTILRYFNIYGEGQDATGHAGAIVIFIRKALAQEPVTVNNDGKQVHSWCHVDDAVAGTMLAMDSDKADGEIFNIGNPATKVSVLELAKKIIAQTKSASTIQFATMDKPDIRLRVPNIDKAAKMLGYTPKVSLAEGITRAAQWYQQKS